MNPGAVAFAGFLTEVVHSALGRTRWLDATSADPLRRSRYALRGRINTYGNRVQVVVRLVEIASGRHIWGTAVDGAPTDVPTLQKRLIEGVASNMLRCLRDAEAVRIGRKPAHDRTADELVMRAFGFASALTPGANSRALEDLDKALTIDAEHALAMSLSSWCHAQRAIYNFSGALRTEREEARRLGAIALSLDDEDPQVLAVRGPPAQ